MSRNSRLLRLIGAIGAMYLEWGEVGEGKSPRPGVVNPFQMRVEFIPSSTKAFYTIPGPTSIPENFKSWSSEIGADISDLFRAYLSDLHLGNHKVTAWRSWIQMAMKMPYTWGLTLATDGSPSGWLVACWFWRWRIDDREAPRKRIIFENYTPEN